MKSAVYQGRVRHRRFEPVDNRFAYDVFMLWLDLDELDEVFAGRWLWSTRRAAPLCFRRRDHLGDPRVPLADAVRDLVDERTGIRPTGPIRLLTNLRTYGYLMNPVSFYYCYDAHDRRVQAIVAEINNTPWGERHCYVFAADAAEGRGRALQFRFAKDFHVSPFMPMEQSYDWRFVPPDDRLFVHMETIESDRRRLDATLHLTRREITGRRLATILLRHPFMTGKVVAAIYWQAFRLWWKRCPFHPHPDRRKPAGALR
jgi:DUF1365 family protein